MSTNKKHPGNIHRIREFELEKVEPNDYVHLVASKLARLTADRRSFDATQRVIIISNHLE